MLALTNGMKMTMSVLKCKPHHVEYNLELEDEATAI